MGGAGSSGEGGGRHAGPACASPYPLSRLAPRHELVNVAREIEQADALLRVSAGAKLQQIVEQIRALQEQARSVLAEARRDAELHRARCCFVRRPGHVYHLYRGRDGTLVFSLLSPEDWDGEPPHDFQGSFRLETDMSWTPVGEIGRREEAADVVAALLEAADRKG
ncbi:MAG: DUF2452 domain-containing protein [Deltaproteobacteria bacterium]|nr:DUF2452 domain-containing protein [Deltaproteobacteria bacterium]